MACRVAGEAAHRAEPEARGERLDPLFRQPRPGHRLIDGDRARAGSLQVGDEAGQRLTMPAEFEAQRAAHPQVVLQMPGQRAHDRAPPGQGRAIMRSRSTSTRAYAAVEGRAMPQHLPDLGQRSSGAQHVAGGGMPQPVRA